MLKLGIETKTEKIGKFKELLSLKKDKLVFGWVSNTVTQNFEAWATEKAYGTEEESKKFFEKTRNGKEKEGLSWFCHEA